MEKPSFNEIPNKPQDAKKLKHAKILAQINYFINGSKTYFIEIYPNLKF